MSLLKYSVAGFKLKAIFIWLYVAGWNFVLKRLGIKFESVICLMMSVMSTAWSWLGGALMANIRKWEQSGRRREKFLQRNNRQFFIPNLRNLTETMWLSESGGWQTPQVQGVVLMRYFGKGSFEGSRSLWRHIFTYFPRESQEPNSTWEREVCSETAQLWVMVQTPAAFSCAREDHRKKAVLLWLSDNC